MVLGLFSKERAIKRASKKALNRLSQSPDRWAAMEKLLEIGTDETLYVLCQRFSITATKMSEDEQEKEWTVEALTSKGPIALPAVRRYLENAHAVSYPLRVLSSICRGEQALEVIDAVFSREEPGYTRDPIKRIDIINWLSEYKDASNKDVVERVTPYLGDRDENTRFAVVETISMRPSPEAAEPLVTALLNEEEESGRLKLRIAETLAAGEYDLCGRKDEIAELFDDLLSDYRLHRNKLVLKKK